MRIFLFSLPLLTLCVTTCRGQLKVESVEDKGEHTLKDSLKVRGKSGWLKFGNNVKAKISDTKNKVERMEDEATAVGKKTKTKSVRKQIQTGKNRTDRSSVEADLSDVHTGDTLKQAGVRMKERFSALTPDTLHKDRLENLLQEKVQSVEISTSLQKNIPSAAEQSKVRPLKGKTVAMTRGQRNRVISEQKKSLEKYGMEKVSASNENAGTARITIKDQIKKQFTGGIGGSVSLGYEYGILPYVSPFKYPTGGFKSEGRLSLSVLNLPIEVTYRYTTVKGGVGINNYFRVSYDVSRYKNELDQKMVVREQLRKIKLDQLQMSKQEMAMKMEYANLLANLKLPEFNLPDITPEALHKLDLPGNPVDSTEVISYLNSKNEYLHKKDSVLKVISEYKARYLEYKARYDSLTNSMELVSSGLEKLKNINAKDKIKTDSYTSKVETFFSGIRKFEIGLCNPSYSLFLVSNAPLKGINFEYEKAEHFFAVTYGTTVNNLFYNPNTLQGKLLEVRNFYNFFDFNNLSLGRKVLAIKGGLGQKEGSHFFVGVLLGKGKMDYLTVTDPKYGKKESNVVLELDGKYKFSEQLSAEMIVGKSSLQSEDLSIEQLKSSFREIFSPFRSNALQARVNYDIQKTKTKLQVTGRLIDPYFKSFGVTFLRSDNIRYEVKADQQLTRNIKYGFAYRREEDNLLHLINFKNTFTTIQNSLSIRLKKGISIKLNYAPLLRMMKNGDMVVTDRNAISTAIVSYVPKMKTIQVSYNLLYSKYRVSSDSGNIHFDNVTYTHQFQFENGFKTGMNVSWFENTLKDTLNNNTYLGVVDLGYTTKSQNSFTIGGKIAYRHGIATEAGFLAKATLKLYKTLFWETEAEKILAGDYYSSLVDAKVRRFPYYLSSKLIINF